MKIIKLLCYILAFSVLTVSLSCSGKRVLRPEPPQEQKYIPDPKVSVQINNETSAVIFFQEGPLEGIIINGYGTLVVYLPIGWQRICWNHTVLRRDDLDYSCDEIGITSRTSLIEVIPPEEDNVYYTRGQGRLHVSYY